MDDIKLIVFDMAGTTVMDDKDIETCFYNAALKTGLKASRERIRELQGYPKEKIIRTLWEEAAGKDNPELDQAVANTNHLFEAIVENHFRLNDVKPAEGAVDTFKWLRAEGVKIALTSSLYRKVVNIILGKLGWLEGLDDRYVGDETSLIDLSLTTDEVEKGRPSPDMILRAMEILGIKDPKQVIKVGDTPPDLEAGRAAKCRLTVGVTNGSYSRAQLMEYDSDGLVNNLEQLRDFLPAQLTGERVKS